MSDNTEPVTARCKVCLDSGFISDDGNKIPKSAIAAKHGTRPAWSDLLDRYTWVECPQCAGVAHAPKRKYTKKKSTYWQK